MKYVQIHKVPLAAMALLAPILGHADDYTTEWRVMGPAFSYHSNNDDAQVRQVGKFYECSATNSSLGYVYETPENASVSLMNSLGIPSRECPRSNHTTSPGGQYLRSTLWAGITHYEVQSSMYENAKYIPFTPIAKIYLFREAVKEWNSNNPAAGLQYTRRYDDHSVKAFANFVKDSYGSPSLMLGAAYMWPLINNNDRWSVDVGVVGGIWFRTTLNTDNNQLSRATVPFVFPGLSFTEKTTGLGLDIGAVPRVSFDLGGHYYSMPTTVMVQATYLISKSERGTKRIAVEPKPDGLNAVLTMSFY